LTAPEWLKLERLHTSLHAFYEVTVTSEGRADTLQDYVQDLDYLLDKIDAASTFYCSLKNDEPSADNNALFHSSVYCFSLLEKYMNYCDGSGAYYAAHVLNPGRKWTWFEENWGIHPDKAAWITTVQSLVQKLWKEEYSEIDRRASQRSSPDRAVDPEHPFIDLLNHKRIKLSNPLPPQDAYLHYCSTPHEYDVDPLEYWNLVYSSGRSPALAQFALGMLAIPAMSSECERTFSSAKRLLNDRRNRLQIDAIEANECLRSWYGPPSHGDFDMDTDIDLQAAMELEDDG
jgi:hypothetical protein